MDRKEGGAKYSIDIFVGYFGDKRSHREKKRENYNEESIDGREGVRVSNIRFI